MAADPIEHAAHILEEHGREMRRLRPDITDVDRLICAAWTAWWPARLDSPRDREVRQLLVERERTRRCVRIVERSRRGAPHRVVEADLLNLAGWLDDLPGQVTTTAQFFGPAT